jgi:hypothetical protein
LADLQDWDYDSYGGRILLPNEYVSGLDTPESISIDRPRDRKHPQYPFEPGKMEKSLYHWAHQAFAPTYRKFQKKAQEELGLE